MKILRNKYKKSPKNESTQWTLTNCINGDTLVQQWRVSEVYLTFFHHGPVFHLQLAKWYRYACKLVKIFLIKSKQNIGFARVSVYIGRYSTDAASCPCSSVSKATALLTELRDRLAGWATRTSCSMATALLTELREHHSAWQPPGLADWATGISCSIATVLLTELRSITQHGHPLAGWATGASCSIATVLLTELP